jgi:hypothetical protein
LCFFLAHGEGWEIVASRAVSDLVKKVLGEQHHTAEQVQENGTFELHYTPSDAKMKRIKFLFPIHKNHLNINLILLR